MKKMTNDAIKPAIVTHINPHHIPKIAPAASEKIDSGNRNVVLTIKRMTNKTGPQIPSDWMNKSTLGIEGVRTKWKRQNNPTNTINATIVRMR